jgi:AcrR family transcriptional regulator
MKVSDKNNKKSDIVQHTWNHLLKYGLSKSSIGELCRETGLSQSSLYHWFENKDELWISAGKYGLSKVVDALFTYTFNHTNDIDTYFKCFLDEVDKYKLELRLAVQITTSPIYGERMRERSRGFRVFYKQYADKITEVFGCTELQANVFIYSIISVVIDYVVWDDKDIAQMLLDNLHDRVNSAIEI